MAETQPASLGGNGFTSSSDALPAVKHSTICCNWPPSSSDGSEGLVAPHIKGCLLGPTMFSKVRCFDVSADGFWCLAEVRQTRPAVVVSLRLEHGFSYALADVVSCELAEVDGVRLYRIECRFRGDLPRRQEQILRQLWLLQDSGRVAGRPQQTCEFSCEHIF